MADTIHLELVTPEKQLVSTDVSEITAQSLLGEIGILPDHANYITVLELGKLSYVEGGKKKELAVTGGFAEVTLDEGIRILAEAAEYADQIDIDRAREAKERAERRIKDFDPDSQDVDIMRAELALKRALLRIDVAGR